MLGEVPRRPGDLKLQVPIPNSFVVWCMLREKNISVAIMFLVCTMQVIDTENMVVGNNNKKIVKCGTNYARSFKKSLTKFEIHRRFNINLPKQTLLCI